MAGITLSNAETQLSQWLDALTAISTSQSYSIGGRSLTRANLSDVEKQVEFWDKKVKNLSRGGIRVRGATPT
tara:strand:+ start:1853 stop:2068 length:216 start_codon:yes stop_codon:yes gene_type:complete